MAIEDKRVNPVIRMWILGGVTLAAVFLSSCVNTSVYFEDLARKYAADTGAMAARLQAQPPCCASFDDIRYEKVAKKFIQINLSAASPTFDFDEGRSRFRAFELPELAVGDSITLIQIDRIHKVGAPMIKPMLLLLSKEHEVIMLFAPEEFPKFYLGWKDSGSKAVLEIDERMAAARYAVVAANPAWFGRSFTVKAGSNSVGSGAVAAYTSNPEFHIPYSSEGRTYFALETEARLSDAPPR